MTRIAHAIDQGLRPNFEDALNTLVFQRHAPFVHQAAVLVVADGVGGNVCGEVASELAVDTVVLHLWVYLAASLNRSGLAPSNEAIGNSLHKVLLDANETILGKAKQEPEMTGMSTTAVLAVILDCHLYVAWAGDSRCYLYRRQQLRQLTRDHSEIQALVDSGIFSPEEAKVHPLSHCISQYLGKEDLVAETAECPLEAGDLVLLCSDGLTDALSDEQIVEHLTAYENGAVHFSRTPDRMLQHALDAGATDNISILLAEHRPLGSAHAEVYPLAAARAIHRYHKETCHA